MTSGDNEACPVTMLPCDCPIFCTMQMQTLSAMLDSFYAWRLDEILKEPELWPNPAR